METVGPESRNSDQLSFWETEAPAPPRTPKRSKVAAKKVLSKLDHTLSSTVGKEIMHGDMNPATWAMALAYSNGSRDHAITHYARLRLEDLSEIAEFKNNKEAALEARRRSTFRKAPTPPPRPYSGNLPTPKKSNRRRARLSPLWLGGFWLGAAGALASATRNYSESLDLPGLRIGLTGSIGIAASIVCLVVILHLTLHRTRTAIRHLVPVGAWCAAVVSFYCGLMIMERASAGPRSAVVSSSSKKPEIEKKILPPEPLLQPVSISRQATPKPLAQAR